MPHSPINSKRAQARFKLFLEKAAEVERLYIQKFGRDAYLKLLDQLIELHERGEVAGCADPDPEDVLQVLKMFGLSECNDPESILQGLKKKLINAKFS